MMMAAQFWTLTATGVGIICGMVAVLGVIWRAARSLSKTLESIEENTRDIHDVRRDVAEVKTRLIARTEHQADEMRQTLTRIERKVS